MKGFLQKKNRSALAARFLARRGGIRCPGRGRGSGLRGSESRNGLIRVRFLENVHRRIDVKLRTQQRPPLWTLPYKSLVRKCSSLCTYGELHNPGLSPKVRKCSSLCTYDELENAGFVAKMRKCSSLCTYGELENAGSVAESVQVLQSVHLR